MKRSSFRTDAGLDLLTAYIPGILAGVTDMEHPALVAAYGGGEAFTRTIVEWHATGVSVADASGRFRKTLDALYEAAPSSAKR